jgi:RHS repeat-associated protein
MGALKLSYYENNISVNGSDYSLLKVVAKDGVIITQSSNYYTFGMALQGRKYTGSSSYRYGFNGKENDKETVGTGEGTQDYGMRIYNPSLGKFLSVDPLSPKYPELTPYQFASNTPIWAIDLDGLESAIGSTEGVVGLGGHHHITGDTDNNGIIDNKERTASFKAVGLVVAVAVITVVDIYLTKGKMFQAAMAYDLGTGVEFGEKAMQAKKNGDYEGYVKYSQKAKEAYLGLAVGYLGGKVISYGFSKFSKYLATNLSEKAQLLTKESESLEVQIADAEGMEYLNSVGAEATYFSEEGNKGFMLVKPNANRAVVLEEMIHHNQKNINGEKVFFENQTKFEIEAQDILLEVGKKEGWSAEELKKIESAKAAWEAKAQKN